MLGTDLCEENFLLSEYLRDERNGDNPCVELSSSQSSPGLQMVATGLWSPILYSSTQYSGVWSMALARAIEMAFQGYETK